MMAMRPSVLIVSAALAASCAVSACSGSSVNRPEVSATWLACDQWVVARCFVSHADLGRRCPIRYGAFVVSRCECVVFSPTKTNT